MSTVQRIGGRVPAVEVFFSILPAGTVRATLWRLAAGQTMPVRGAVNVATAGQLTRIDYEAPFGVVLAYRAECFDANGHMIGVTDTITHPGIDEPATWLSNPLDPQGAITCELRARTGRVLHQPMQGSVIDTSTRVGVIAGGHRAGLRDLELDVLVQGGDAADAVQRMLGRGAERLPPVLCLRLGAGNRRRLPRPFFLYPEWAEVDVTHLWGGETIGFEGRVQQAEPPAPGLFVPLLTYGDLARAYETYADLNSDNVTYGHVNRRYDLAQEA